jgi:5-methylcytosine-specific restriction endonuclease McrA
MTSVHFILALTLLIFITFYLLPKILKIHLPITKTSKNFGMLKVQIKCIKESIGLMINQLKKADIKNIHSISVSESQVKLKIGQVITIADLTKQSPDNFSFNVTTIKNKLINQHNQFSFGKEVFEEVEPNFKYLKDFATQRKNELTKLLIEYNNLGFSDAPEDYVIQPENFKRNNPADARYRKLNLLNLLKLFDNKCANCGNTDNGIDLDHFFISKTHGGNFKLQHKTGKWINNAIPLCKSCNREKSSKGLKFFTQTKMLEILAKNATMTSKLN